MTVYEFDYEYNNGPKDCVDDGNGGCKRPAWPPYRELPDEFTEMSCRWVGVDLDIEPPFNVRPPNGGGYEWPALEERNECDIYNYPDLVEVDITKKWTIEGAGGDAYSKFAKIMVASTYIDDTDAGKCPKMKHRHGGGFEMDEGRRSRLMCLELEFEAPDSETVTVEVAPDDWKWGTDVYVWESDLDSYFESTNDCEGLEVYAGDTDVECEFHNVLFFEGIPTLNQYGLAIMALLMLGVGFVGFRRFV